MVMDVLALLRSRNQPDLPIEPMHVARWLVPVDDAENAQLVVGGWAVQGGDRDGDGEEDSQLAGEERHVACWMRATGQGVERGAPCVYEHQVVHRL